MGNIGSNQNDLINKSELNLVDIQELKKVLGTCSVHRYQNELDALPEEIVGNIDLGIFSVQSENKDYINNFLSGIRNYIISSHLKENWPNESFQNELEGAILKESKFVQKEITDDIEFDDSKVKSVYEGFCIYEMPETEVKMALPMREVNIESCYVGLKGDNLALFAPSEEPSTTQFLRIAVKCYVLENNNLQIHLENLEGTVFGDITPVLSNDGKHFVHLNNAFISYENNNSREMSSHTNKFVSWKTECQKEGKIVSYSGGEAQGELLSLGDIFDRLKFT